MTVSGVQEFWVVGSRFYFQNDDSANEALLDLGVIQVASPTIETEKIELEDADGGVRRVVDEAITKMSETYDLVCNNFNLDNLAMLFMADKNSPADFTQAITKIENVAHIAAVGPGKHVKIKDASGNWLYGIQSIDITLIVSATTTTPVPATTTTTAIPIVENVDYEWVSKDRGIINIIDGGAIDDGDTMYIDITPKAITGRRLVYPQTGAILKGHAMLVWGRGGNVEQTVREADVTISTSAANFQVEDYSDFTLQAKVVSDVTETTAPAGKLLQFKGTLPAE